MNPYTPDREARKQANLDRTLGGRSSTGQAAYSTTGDVPRVDPYSMAQGEPIPSTLRLINQMPVPASAFRGALGTATPSRAAPGREPMAFWAPTLFAQAYSASHPPPAHM